MLGVARDAYAGRRVAVIGGGHSAANALLDLARLAESEPAMQLVWAVRSRDLTRAEGPVTLGPVDRIIVATGQRPDLALTRELRLDLDPWLEAPRALAPEIDPNLHSCGSVQPHGYKELLHPEPGFFVAGVKSYGRAPTFLMATGYEQVRSIAAYLAGDLAAANDVRLVLPETGVCTTDFGAEPTSNQGCCGGPAPKAAEACCMADAEAKAEGNTGCGCSSKPVPVAAAGAPPARACCG